VPEAKLNRLEAVLAETTEVVPLSTAPLSSRQGGATRQ
jgi:hypothetical protein